MHRDEQALLSQGWEKTQNGLEVKLSSSPEGAETFVLCRSEDRARKEKAIHKRFEKKIEKGLGKIVPRHRGCRKRKQKIGRLLGANTRGAGLFKVEVKEGKAGGAELAWEKVEAWREWAELSEGCYMLRTNITDWQAGELWEAYIQLTQAVPTCRDPYPEERSKDKTDLASEGRQGESTYPGLLSGLCIMEDAGQMCQRANLANEPRKVFDEIAQIKVVDVVMLT